MKLILKPTACQVAQLETTTLAFTSAFNQAVAIGWAAGITNATKLHYAAYYAVKASHPTLVADLVNQARAKAAEALRGIEARRKQGRTVTCPVSRRCPPRFNVHTYKVDWEARCVRLSTTGGRQTIAFKTPAYAGRFTQGALGSADLIFSKGRWYLHVTVQLPGPEFVPSQQTIGVDLGMVQPAVTSHGRFLGQRRWRQVNRRYFRLLRALQAKGSRSARRHIRRLHGKQRRFHIDCDHVLSKRVLQTVDTGSTIVLETLKDIRDRARHRKGAQRRMFHEWSFARLRRFIEYKAEERGCMVVEVNPRHTSQACSRCGHIARNNRRSRGRFVCRACGFELHADLNAARNIAAKYLVEGGMLPPTGCPVNQPNVPKGLRVTFEHKPPVETDGG